MFWVLAAGKNATTAAKSLDSLLMNWIPVLTWSSPFGVIKQIARQQSLPAELKRHGIGCFNNKAKTLLALATSNLDLKTCTLKDLESINGVGPKTARCFLMHSRPNQRLAGLDVHCLKFLKSKGHDVPSSTPTGKRYLELEKLFLTYADASGKSPAEFDLECWNKFKKQKWTVK